MAEFGCNTNTREWEEVKSLLGTDMSPVYSGGIAYEYTVEPNGYGLVELGSNGEIKTNDDFERLAKAYAAQPDPKDGGGYSENVQASECPKPSDDWEVEDELIPAMPKGAQKFMSEGAGKGPGLGDPKTVAPSQWGGDTYSEEMITMDGEKSDKAPASVGSDGSVTNSNKPGAASSLTIAPVMGLVSFIAAAYML